MSSYMRGLGTNVKDCFNNPSQIIEKAGLNWSAGLVPLQSIDNQIYNGLCGIRNNSNREFIDSGKPVSSKFKLHDHKEILTDFCLMASDNGLNVTHVTQIHNGEHVYLRADIPQNFEISNRSRKVGDIVGANVVFDISYTPGIASRCRPQALRLVCTNGMTAGADITADRLYLTHRKKYTHEERANIRGQFEAIAQKVGKLVENISILNNFNSTPALNAAYTLNVIQPTLLDQVIQETMDRGYITTTTHKWGFLELLRESEPVIEMMLQNKVREEGSRQVKSLLDEIIMQQEGAEFSEGTLAHPFNALTYQIDHVRGRGPDAAVQYALFGEGSKIKTEALEIGLEYVRNLQ